MNHDLLDKTLHKIETLEAFKAEGLPLDETWAQYTWARHLYDSDYEVCGTSYCFAGWAVLEAGLHIDVDDQSVIETGRSIPHEARDLLGFDRDQTGDLFWGTNDLDDLRRIVAKLHAGDTP